MSKGTLLIVDDEEGIRSGLALFFGRRGYTPLEAASEGEALAHMEKRSLDAAVLDVRLGSGPGGLALLDTLRGEQVPCIMITGFATVQDAVDAMKRGAADYLTKPVDTDRLLASIERVIELRRLKTQNEYLRSELRSIDGDRDLVSADAAMAEIVATLDAVKDTDAAVLITGESGTGKEVLARYVHYRGSRRSGNFVAVNSAALSETLLLSELFGHERGAFTGAVERKLGKLEVADGGTLFLDEIGDMGLEVQAKLLRVLEERSFERLGGTKRIEADLRFISATNKDLEKAMREGLFRSDLFWRIKVVHVHLPPLRRRPADIPLLVDHFLAKFSEKYAKPRPAVDGRTMDRLCAYPWPGNIRELQNVMNLSVLLSGEVLKVRGLEEGCGESEAASVPAPGSAAPRALIDASRDAAAGAEREIILRALDAAGGNKTRAAAALGITRKTLRLKARKYGLDAE